MRIKQFLCVLGLCGVGAMASADTLLGQVPIGIKGTFTIELLGCTNPTTGTATYVKNTVTGIVTLRLPQISCVSTTTGAAMLSGLPTEILPPENVMMPLNVIVPPGRVVPGFFYITTADYLIRLAGWDGMQISGNPFVPGGLKGLASNGHTVTYQGTPDT